MWPGDSLMQAWRSQDRPGQDAGGSEAQWEA